MKTLKNAAACLASLLVISSAAFAGPIIWHNTNAGVSAQAFALDSNGDYSDSFFNDGVGVGDGTPTPIHFDGGFRWDHPGVRMDSQMHLVANSQQLIWTTTEDSSAADGYRLESGSFMWFTFTLTSARNARISISGADFLGEMYGGLGGGPAGVEWEGEDVNQSLFLPAGEYNYFFLLRSKGSGTNSFFRLRFQVPESGHTLALFAGALAALGLVKARRRDPR